LDREKSDTERRGWGRKIDYDMEEYGGNAVRRRRTRGEGEWEEESES
jgi:hypothetical protein